jgi:hypothetical protein
MRSDVRYCDLPEPYSMRTIFSAALSGLGALVIGLTPAQADTATPFASTFGTPKDGISCWGHTYDAPHLDQHSGQKTQSIAIDVAPAKTNGEANTPESFEIGFALKVRTSPEWYGQAGVCKAEGQGFSCFLEGDGGLFRLTPEGEGQLRLETGDYGISIEGGKDFVTLEGQSGADKVFILQRSKAECDEANAFFLRKR